MHETAPDPARNELVPLDEERAVIERLQAGDRTAFATLYGWYGERLYRQVIWPRVGSREAAEDVLRETFRIALEKIGSFTYDGKSVFFWLRRIAINRATATSPTGSARSPRTRSTRRPRAPIGASRSRICAARSSCPSPG